MAWVRRYDGKRGRRYRVHYRDPAGAERSRTFARARDAQAFAEAVETDKGRGDYRDPRAGNETLGSYLERFLEAAVELAPATIELYRAEARNHILPRLGTMPLGSIRRAEVRGFLAALVDAGTGRRTIELCRAILSRVLSEAEADEVIKANPVRHVRLVERPSVRTRDVVVPPAARRSIVPLSVEEVDALAGAIEARYRVMAPIGGYAGLRWGEVAALRRSRMRLLERKIEISEGLTEVRGQVALGPLKSKASRRTVSIPASLAEEIAEHMAASMGPVSADPTGEDLLFTSPEGGPLRRTNWRRRVWLPAVDTAGIETSPRFHDLRHTAAALAIAEGAHPKALQARLGHSSITVTLDTYGHLFPHLDEDLAERLEARRSRAAERLRNVSAPPAGPISGPAL